jgi:hypothetical protein
MRRLNKKMGKLREKMSALHKSSAINIAVMKVPGESSGMNLTSENSPLFILDGKVLNPDLEVSQEAINLFKNLNPNTIQSIEVNKEANLFEQYPHERTKNGVVEIFTKK